MAKLVFELNQSLDGYVDHQAFGPPDPALFRHFTERVRGLTGMLYGRGMYEVMRYWDEDSPDWDADEREYAAVWRSRPKWVVSRLLESVGPNAGLVAPRGGGSGTEDKARRRDRSRRTRLGASPDRTWPHREKGTKKGAKRGRR